MGLEAECEKGLRELASPVSVWWKSRSFASLRMTRYQARELHRDGRCAGDDMARAQIVAHRASNRPQIDAVMIPEPPVLDRNERIDDISIDLAIRNPSLVAAVLRACRAKGDPIAVLDRHALPAIAREHRRREWHCNPCSGREDERGEHPRRDLRPEPQASHRLPRGVTT